MRYYILFKNFYLCHKKEGTVKLELTENKIYNNFFKACQNDSIDIAKFLYFKHKIDIHFNDEYAFYLSCVNNHLEIAEWLIELGEINHSPINIHVDNEKIFKECWRNILHCKDIINWLIELGNRIDSPINIRATIKNIKFAHSGALTQVVAYSYMDQILTNYL